MKPVSFNSKRWFVLGSASLAAAAAHAQPDYAPAHWSPITGHDEKKIPSWVSWMAANYPSINATCNSHTDPGQYWNWSHFMDLINGAVNNAQVVGSSVPSSVLTGQTFTVTITLNNNGTIAWTNNSGNPYK